MPASSLNETNPAEALGTCSAAYAALGVGTIREAMINVDELLAYQDGKAAHWSSRTPTTRTTPAT